MTTMSFAFLSSAIRAARSAKSLEFSGFSFVQCAIAHDVLLACEGSEIGAQDHYHIGHLLIGPLLHYGTRAKHI
jgi:hypothetical protein